MGGLTSPESEIYLDVETLRLSDEVEGGWTNIRAFGLALAVTWDIEHGFRRWYENEVASLVTELAGFSRIITFNGNRFDLEVLQGYTPIKELRTRSFDLLTDLQGKLGHRVKLERLARETLGRSKTGSGIQAVQWWRAGQREKVARYCEEDVRLLIEMVAHARKAGYVMIGGRQVRVNW
jgi:DEAD/DEAH box helicase domain-containing protein